MSDQSGIRVSRRRGFTMVYNDLLPTDGSLSARAWGIYVYLAGRPDGWETRVSHLQTVFREGRDAIYAALRELVDAGLMGKETYIDSGLRRTRFTLDADPVVAGQPPRADSQEPGTPEPGDPDAETPEPEKPGQVTTDPPTTEPATNEGATTTPSSKRGTRLAADWKPDEELRQWFREHPELHVVNPVTESAKFVDYWTATPGQRGVKLDWHATWRNWMRTAAERLTGKPNGRGPTHPPVSPENTARFAELF